jgi:hypothetical protein
MSKWYLLRYTNYESYNNIWNLWEEYYLTQDRHPDWIEYDLFSNIVFESSNKEEVIKYAALKGYKINEEPE